jgi:diguanylate cyclase (GGDEF)-like protein
MVKDAPGAAAHAAAPAAHADVVALLELLGDKTKVMHLAEGYRPGVEERYSKNISRIAAAVQSHVDSPDKRLVMSAAGKSAHTSLQRIGLSLSVTLKIIFALGIASAMWFLVWTTIAPRPWHWVDSLFVPAAVLLVIGLMVLRTERRWARPARQLAELLPQVCDGQVAIEALEEVNGGLGASLIPIIQSVLLELKQQRQAMAELNEEIRQRIASRTDALERQIGALKQQATRDALTGLHNRRLLDAYLPPLLEKCAAEKIDLSILMIDVDHFKLLNDTLGHGAGDELLRNIAQIIRSGVRDQDAAFRVGGDEFVVVLPGATPQVAESISLRMKTLVDALGRQLRVDLPPSVSVGIHSISQMRVPNAVHLIQEADRKLYEAKGSRRRVAAKAG